MAQKAIFFVVIAVVVAGCASFRSATYYPEGKYAPTDPSRVQIYWNNPTREFEVIGESHLSTGVIMKGTERDFKKQIAAMGGDAAICQILRDCTEVTVVPAQTNIAVVRPTAHKTGVKEVTTVQEAPAQIKTNCVSWTECKIIKFVT